MVRLSHDLNRREFVSAMSAGLALLPALGTNGLAQAIGPRRSRVALVRTTDRKRGVAQALKLFGVSGVKDRKVVLKPNFNSADETPGSTHMDTLSQIVAELQERGARTVTLGESSGPPQTQRRHGEEGRVRSRPRPEVLSRGLRADRRVRLGLVPGRHVALDLAGSPSPAW